MKKLTHIFLLLLCNLSLSQKGMSDTFQEYLKDVPNKTMLSIALIENGEVIYYGVIKESDSIRFIDNKDFVFEIGSITKVFTSTLLANLIVNQKLSPKATINNYFNFPFNKKIKLRFIDLANHTSGLSRLPSNLFLSKFDNKNPYKWYNSSNLNDLLKVELTLESKPGTHYNYSNFGAGLLGCSLGLSQNKSYSQLLQELIFDKYKMANSFTSKDDVTQKLIKGLNINGEETENWDFNILAGAGCILSTTEDLTKFAIAQFDPENKELALTQVPSFTISDNMKIGMGWHILKLKSGKEFIWHNGGTGGYTSSMALDAENKNGVIILSNVSPSNDGIIDKLCLELLEKITDH